MAADSKCLDSSTTLRLCLHKKEQRRSHHTFRVVCSYYFLHIAVILAGRDITVVVDATASHTSATYSHHFCGTRDRDADVDGHCRVAVAENHPVSLSHPDETLGERSNHFVCHRHGYGHARGCSYCRFRIPFSCYFVSSVQRQYGFQRA